MANSNAEVDSVYKSLRLLPEFDGNTNVLTRFIHLCDQLVAAHIKPGPDYELSNLCLINGILNKITGPAARTINSNGIAENWASIRSALINNFADHRDETALYNDLSLLTQGSNTPHEFYERCQSLFSTIMTYISLHENVATTIEAKRDLYKKLTLQSFLRGLKDPLGSRIRCMRPETIEIALQFVQEESNVLYLQQRSQHFPERKPQSTGADNSFNQGFKIMPNQPPMNAMSKPFIYNMPPGPSRAPPQMYQPNWKPMPMHFNQNQGPTRTQQMFAARPPNYNQQNNSFHMQPRNPPTQNFTGPKPMSGVSHFSTKPLPPTGHDWRKFGNPPPSNYFKTREMNFNDCYSYNQEQPVFYDPYYECYYQAEPYEPQYPSDYVQESIEYTETSHDEASENNATYAENEEDFRVNSRSDKPK